MRAIALILFVLFSLNCLGQTSGYLGKRFSLSANMLFNSNVLLIPVEVDAKGENPIKYYTDPKSSFAAEFILGRRTALGLRAEFNNLEYVDDVYIYDPVTGQDFEYRTTVMNLKVNNLGLSFKFFTESSMAPIGVYSQVDLGYMKYELIDKEGATRQKGRQIHTQNGAYIAYTMGRQQMLMKNLLFNVGVEVRYCTVIFPTSKNSSIDNKHIFPLPDGHVASVNYELSGRLLRSYVFNARLGLGYMLF